MVIMLLCCVVLCCVVLCGVVFHIEREIERKRVEAELAERNKPLKEKFSNFVDIAKEVSYCWCCCWWWW